LGKGSLKLSKTRTEGVAQVVECPEFNSQHHKIKKYINYDTV
jgi:hypothetical protein